MIDSEIEMKGLCKKHPANTHNERSLIRTSHVCRGGRAAGRNQQLEEYKHAHTHTHTHTNTHIHTCCRKFYDSFIIYQSFFLKYLNAINYLYVMLIIVIFSIKFFQFEYLSAINFLSSIVKWLLLSS